MRTTKLLKRITFLNVFFVFVSFTSISAQKTEINFSNLSVNEYASQHKQSIGDFQTFFIVGTNKDAKIVSGEAAGIAKNNANSVVVFTNIPDFDVKNLKIVLNGIKYLSLEEFKELSAIEIETLHLEVGNEKLLIHF